MEIEAWHCILPRFTLVSVDILKWSITAFFYFSSSFVGGRSAGSRWVMGGYLYHHNDLGRYTIGARLPPICRISSPWNRNLEY